ncbi:hypothetical protein ACTGVV_11610, partial [Streptococcus suis]
KKIVQDNRDKRKTQTVRLNFIKISLNLSVFFIYWLVFAQPLFKMGGNNESRSLTTNDESNHSS